MASQSLRRYALVAAVLTALPVAAQVPAPDFTWNNYVSVGTGWNVAANWLPGAPVSTTDTVLGFSSATLQTVTGYTTTNNTGTFNVNSLVFSALSTSLGGITVTNTTATDTIAFNTSSTGTLPSIWQVGSGRVAFRHVVLATGGITLAGGATGTTLQILGNGVGDTYIDTSIVSTGTGASGLLINQTGGQVFNTGAQVRLGGSNSAFTGNVTLQAGNLMLSNVLGTTGREFNGTASVAATPVNALGSGTLIVNGGSLMFDPIAISSGATPTGITGTLQVNNAITLNSTLNIVGVAPATAPSGGIVGIFAGNIGGTGGITIAPIAGTLNYGFTGTNTFSGPLVIQPIGNTVSTVLVGTANVSTGTLSGTTSLTVTGNSSLSLNNVFGALTRLNTVTPPTLTLNRGNFNLLGNPTASVSETLSTLTTNGMGSLTIQSGSGTANSATLTFSGLNRGADGRGTLAITAQNMGSGTGAGEGILVFSSDPGGAIGGGGGAGTTNRNILPYAMANSQNLFAGISATLSAAGTTLNGTFISGGSTNNLGFVRWDSATNRIAPLNLATEYATNLYLAGASAPNSNFRIASTAAAPLAFGAAGIDQATTVNSLILDTNTVAAAIVGTSLQGTGVLTVNGGAILVGTNGNTGVGTVTLPSMINTAGLNFGATTGYIHTAVSLVINSPITGSGGVVKSQLGTLILNGNNTFTGGLTLNAGPVQFSSDANLGAAGQPLTINSGLTTALTFQPFSQFVNATSPSTTVNRPITLGAGNGVISVIEANSNLTLPGVISGPGQLLKAGGGILTLAGNNTYGGNTVAAAGILAVQNDAALGGASSSIQLSAGTFQPLTSFSTNRNILVAATSLLFTGGQNLTVNGILTAQQQSGAILTLFKVGTGDLVLTAANTFNQSLQLGESTPTIRASAPAGAQTAGRLILTGANGSLAQAASVFAIGGGELVLDNATNVNQNRLGNVTLSIIGGRATLIGNAGTSINETIGALSINNANNQYGGVLTLITPAGSGQSTTLTATAAFSTQAAPNVGTLFVRGTNLGAGAGDRTAVVLPTNPTATNGLIPSIVLATSATGDPTDFATTATITNPAPNVNQFALTPFTAYTAGGALGAGSATATYDVASTATTFAGASAANALRIGAGGSVNLNAGTLTLSASNVLAAGGANGGIISTGGTGTLNYGAGVAARFIVGSGSDLAVNANITGTTGGLTKLGDGVLTINGAVTTTTGLMGIAAGTLRYGTANVLPIASTPFINTGGTLDLNNTASTLGGLVGWGDTNIGTGTLTLNVGVNPILAYGGGFVGSGTLVKRGVIVAATNGFQVLVGNSPSFNGGVQVLEGQLTVNSTGALGVGTSPILLGDTVGADQAVLAFGSSVGTISRDITVQPGGNTTLRHTISVGVAAGTLSSNILINNTTNTYTSGGITLAGVGLQLSGVSGLAGGTYNQTGTISGPGGLLVFSGNWSFAGNNTYTGGTMLDTTTSTTMGIGIDSTPTAGTVTSGPFGTGPILFTTGFGINLRADGGTPRTIANAIQISGTGGHFGVVGSNALTLNGTVNLQAAAVPIVLNINNAATTTINGVISNGTAGITKNGPGVLAVTANNTYTGSTTINAGTFLANNSSTGSATGTGNVTVNAGAILGGNGFVVPGTGNTLTVAANGVVAPGNSIGTLTAGSAATTTTVNLNGILTAEVSTGGAADRLTVFGDLVLGATSVLNLPATNTYDPIASGTNYILISYTGTGTGTFGSVTPLIPAGYFVAYGTQIANAVTLSPVPEPAHVLAIGAGAMGLLRWYRRRKASRQES